MSTIPETVETTQDAARRLAAPALRDGFRPQGLHAYRDSNGEALFWRIRCKHPDGRKWVRPMHWNGGAYVIGEPPASEQARPLYRLPDLLAADPARPVYIVEGEWAADHLHKLGIVVATSGSASSCEATDWTPLRGRQCLVWPDNDKAGTKYGEAVANKLRAQGCNVSTIDVAALGLAEHGDVVDWLAEHPGATAADILALPTVEGVNAEQKGHRVELINAATLSPERVRWIWLEWLARGKLHVLAGAPGTGKTTLALSVASSISTGHPLPDGSRPVVGHVLIWSGEDDPRDTLLPRLLAAGADVSRVSFVGNVQEDGQSYPFDPARHVEALTAAAAELGNIALLIVDPLVSAVCGDSHKNAEVRRSLAPLVELASTLDAAVLGITHYSKGTSGRDPLERVSGSLAFGALPRVVLGTARKQGGEEQAQRMILVRAKSNIGPDGGGFTYGFEQAELPEHNELTASRIAWGEPIEGTARELLAELKQGGDSQRTKCDEAADWLFDLLSVGPIPRDEVEKRATEAGLSWATVRRAKDKVGARSEKSDFESAWRWVLPDGAFDFHEGAQGAHIKTGEHLRGPRASSTESKTCKSEFRQKNVNCVEGAQGAQPTESEYLREHLGEHVRRNADGDELI